MSIKSVEYKCQWVCACSMTLGGLKRSHLYFAVYRCSISVNNIHRMEKNSCNTIRSVINFVVSCKNSLWEFFNSLPYKTNTLFTKWLSPFLFLKKFVSLAVILQFIEVENEIIHQYFNENNETAFKAGWRYCL